MNNLMKIRDVTLTYNITTRTLRYYEDIGLLTSIRESNSTYRSYEPSQIHRLEQILMLRKLNVSIKEIKAIFTSNQAGVLLEILDHKVNDIDAEMSILQDLKTLILQFLQQLKDLTLQENLSIKLLMDRITAFENQMTNKEKYETKYKYKEVTAMSHVPDVRLVTLPSCKMVSSGLGTFGEENFDRFDRWFSKFPCKDFEQPKDFLWYDPERNGLVWWYAFSEGMDPEGFPIELFDGGFYVAAVSKDGDDIDGDRVYQGIKQWIQDSKIFELDERPNHYTMSHIITSKEAQKAMGYSQLEIMVPVKKCTGK